MTYRILGPVLLICFILPQTEICRGDELEALLSAGRFAEADELLRSFQESTAVPLNTLALGIFSMAGENSISNLKDYVSGNSQGGPILDWARMYIGKYYLAADLYLAAAGQFQEIPPNSPFGVQAKFLAGKAALSARDYYKAEEIFRELSRRKPNSFSIQSDTIYRHLALLELAGIRAEAGKYSESEKLYKQLIESRPGEEIDAAAMIGLIDLQRRKGDTVELERALDAYAKRYSKLPESDSLVAAVVEHSADSLKENRNGIFGNKYYVCVGIFPKKADGEKTAADYRRRGYKAIVESFLDKKLTMYRVLLGSYGSRSQAIHVKESLEKSSGESYTIVIR